MTTRDRLERLTDLVLVLLGAPTPRTLDEIATSVPGYPEGHEARRQAFERDKRVLREEGIPVVAEPVEGPEQFGYRIDPDAFYLPDLGLEPDEQAALHLAVAGVHLGDPSGRDALAKLGATGVAESRPLASLVPPAGLVTLFGALRSAAEVRFAYRGEHRTVAPTSLRFRSGRWYLTGWDRTRDASRTFRVDRIAGSVALGEPGSGLPEGEDDQSGAGFGGAARLREDAGAGRLDPWRPVEGDEDEQVLLLVDAVEAPRLVAEVGEHAVQERRPDGSVLLALGVTNFEVMRSWVLGLLDHAEVVGPPSARAAVVEWLEEMAAGVGAVPQRDPMAGAQEPAEPPTPAVGMSTPAVLAPAGRRSSAASARLRRLLAVVAWLAEVGEASIGEISARFDLPEEVVVHELELAACCGVPPYTPDTLLEIMVTEGSVQAFLPKDLARPRRLTPSEGFALAASARTILAVPGADRHGALARALAKLDTALGDHQRLVIELDAPPLLNDVRSLLDDGMQAEIEYHSVSTDETTVRVVEPLAVVSLDGHWYLDAYCHRAGGVRRFRVDRLRRLRRLHEPVGGHEAERVLLEGGGAGGPESFVAGPGAVTVVLGLDGDARWVADTVPVLSERDCPGGLEITLAVGGIAWLERLLLQVGPHARVLSPPTLANAGARAATRVLARYRS